MSGESVLNLKNLFSDSFKNNRNKIALHDENQIMTYQELYENANRTANALNSYGVTKYKRVALLMSNCIEYVVSEMGIYFSGGTVVGLNDMLGKDEIKYILKDSEAKVAIVGEQFLDTINEVRSELPELTTVIAITNSESIPGNMITWDEFIGNPFDYENEMIVSPEYTSRIMYSGGTTGNPKGAVHCHRTTYLAIMTHLIETQIDGKEKIVLNTPLAHAAYLDLTAGLVKGAEIYIERKFDVESLLPLIEREKITYLSLVPTMIYRILDYMNGKNFNVRSIRTIKYGASTITTQRLLEGLEKFGQVFLQIYGAAETQNCPVWLRKEDHSSEPDKLHLLKSCGKTTVFSQVKIVDEDGRELPTGEVGEIVVNSLSSMIGYNNLPELTKEILKDGWFYTGDIGKMDSEGYLYVLDRKKDMIVTGGMNVYSSEVENVIQKHEDVREVAVIGVPDDDWGEKVMAYIIPNTASIDIEALKEYCDEHLSKYKKPKLFKIVDSLPLTKFGKVDKKKLREPHWELEERKV